MNEFTVGSEQYSEAHRYCPECGSDNIQTTCIGIFGTVDHNAAFCGCGWKGIAHDLVSKKIAVGDIVGFLRLKNARGYPLTGEVLEITKDTCKVNAFGLYGPGTETEITGVLLEEIKPCP